MYQKYNTEALVLGSRETGESDRVYALFTKDFGLVRARASSVRSEKSLMRYALQNYSRANVSLVRAARVALSLATVKTIGRCPRRQWFARISELVAAHSGEERMNTPHSRKRTCAHTECDVYVEIVRCSHSLHARTHFDGTLAALYTTHR